MSTSSITAKHNTECANNLFLRESFIINKTPAAVLWVKCRSTCIAESDILSQICGNSCGICMFLGHIYGSGAVCEYKYLGHTHCGTSF